MYQVRQIKFDRNERRTFKDSRTSLQLIQEDLNEVDWKHINGVFDGDGASKDRIDNVISYLEAVQAKCEADLIEFGEDREPKEQPAAPEPAPGAEQVVLIANVPLCMRAIREARQHQKQQAQEVLEILRHARRLLAEPEREANKVLDAAFAYINVNVPQTSGPWKRRALGDIALFRYPHEYPGDYLRNRQIESMVNLLERHVPQEKYDDEFVRITGGLRSIMTRDVESQEAE